MSYSCNLRLRPNPTTVQLSQDPKCQTIRPKCKEGPFISTYKRTLARHHHTDCEMEQIGTVICHQPLTSRRALPLPRRGT